MQGDNKGRVARWVPQSDGVTVRVWVDSEHGVPVSTAELHVSFQELETWFQAANDCRERWAQRSLF